MLCVLDASFTASLFLPDEASEKSDAVGARIASEGATAPGLWQLEVANVLLISVRRKRITPAQQKQLLDAVDSLPVTLQPIISHQQRTTVMHLAEKYSLSAYDACYLELALRLGLPLATLDVALTRSAKAEGLTTLP